MRVLKRALRMVKMKEKRKRFITSISMNIYNKKHIKKQLTFF